MKTEIQISTTGKVAPPAPRTPAADAGQRQQQGDNKRKAPQPASSSRQVATVEPQQPDAKPSNHTTRKCHWLTRIAKGDDLLPPPPAGQPPPPPPQQPAVRPVGAVQDEYPEEHGAYVVFTSVADDRRSRRLQQQEVNAVASDT